MTKSITVSDAQEFCLSRNIPFYAYRLPGEEEAVFGAQLQGEVAVFDSLQDYAGVEGFIAVPFEESDGEPPFFLRGDVCFRGTTEDGRLREAGCREGGELSPQPSVTYGEYQRQVRAAIAALQGGRAWKMVLARGLTVAAEGMVRASLWFELLTRRYPDAFVFLVSVPGVMTWMGATPETFLQQQKGKLTTMALAGTRPAGQQMPWGQKETEEQAIVSEYIAAKLGPSEAWQAKGPFTQRAGGVEHLCTIFTASAAWSASAVDDLRRRLHPTPAVGGYPLHEALDMIRELEGGKRRYYAGYLGPVHADGEFHWFVNLRSMELFRRAVRLYIGGGITALSDPEEEWKETEMKSRILLDVIESKG